MAKEETLEQKAERLEQELAEANGVIAEQAEALKAAKVENETQLTVIKSGKKSYKVTAPKFIYQGEEKTAEDLKQDEALVKELIKIGFGGLEEIV
jgi:septal ring factor EnvC (AmiA/AmiB activator)